MTDRLGWLTARPIAHRGFHDASVGRPENTLGAAAAAIAANYAIECDVHLSKDGVPVVFHDDDLKRLTGKDGAISDRTVREFADLRVLGSAEPVPTLDALLRLVGGRVPVVIEMKHVVGRDAGLARETLRCVRDYSGPVAVMSFEPALLAEARAIDGQLALGLTAMGDWRTAAAHLRAVIGRRLDFVSYAIDDMPTPMPVLARHLLRLPLICWTVRTEAQLRKARQWTDQITFEGFAA